MRGQGPSSSLPLFGLLAWATLTLLHFFNFFGDSQSFVPRPRHAVDATSGARTLQHDRHLLGQKGEQGEWEVEQERRRIRVEEVCHKWGSLAKFKQLPKRFMYSSKHNLLFCRNAKVGTTTWLAHFLAISDLDTEAQAAINTSKLLHHTVPDLYRLAPGDPPITSLAQSTLSFSMVRHPFERLVSAYQDKVVDNSDPSYTYVAPTLQTKYGEVSFTNFVHFVLDTAKKMCRPPPSACHLDVHWRPYYARCAYCTTPYKVIAKAETFSDDLQHIGRLAGLDFAPLVTHHSSGDTSELAASYFRETPVSLVKALYRLYRPDFDLFDYSPDMYLALAMEE